MTCIVFAMESEDYSGFECMLQGRYMYFLESAVSQRNTHVSMNRTGFQQHATNWIAFNTFQWHALVVACLMSFNHICWWQSSHVCFVATWPNALNGLHQSRTTTDGFNELQCFRTETHWIECSLLMSTTVRSPVKCIGVRWCEIQV